MNKQSDVVIIGGGPAGRTIVHMLYAANKNLSITLIKDEAVNVNRCAVPYGIDGKKPIEKYQIPNTLVTDFGADLIVDTVQDIDPYRKTIHTQKGDSIEYQHLVMATGSHPVMPPIPGIDHPLITPVRSVDDLSVLRNLSGENKKAVVVGGGYIGIEVAVVLKKMGMMVTVVEMMPDILMATTEPEFIEHVKNKLAENDIEIRTREKVIEFSSSSDKVSIKLGSKDQLEADLVVMSAGVTPNMALAADAGLKTSSFGICVNERMQTSVDSIYACGDCAEKYSFVNHMPVRGEFGTNAVFMAKVVARNILGGKVSFSGVLNANATTVYNLSLGSAGYTEKMAEDAGFEVVTGFSKVLDKYPMIDGAGTVLTKLVFNRADQRLIGGSVLRDDPGASQNVDFISFAIQMGATMDDISRYQYATHPELAAKPSDNTYVFAVKNAKSKV